MRRLARRDPVVILVGGVVVVCAALGLFERLELTADQVASLEAGAIMVASAVAMWIDRRRAKMSPEVDAFFEREKNHIDPKMKDFALPPLQPLKPPSETPTEETPKDGVDASG